MKKRLLSILLCVAMVAVMAVGCSSGGSSSDEGSDEGSSEDGGSEGGDVKVGFALKTKNGPYFVSLEENVAKICEENGWEYTCLVADEDSAKEAENIETFISQGMDIIFLDSIDPDACIPSIDAAAEAGIPVINLDSGVNGGNYCTTVYSDNEQNGRLSGIAYAEWMKNNGKEDEEIVAILLSGAKGNVAGRERRTGLFCGIVEGRTGCTEEEGWEAAENIEEQLTSKGNAEFADAKFKIVGQGWGAWLEEEGLTASEDFITANKDSLTTILGENDQMLFGAMTALENAGIKGVAIVAGADGAQAAFDLIKENETADNPYIVSGLNSPSLVAELGCKIAKEVVEGADWESYDDITLTEPAGVTIENVDEYYDKGF